MTEPLIISILVVVTIIIATRGIIKDIKKLKETPNPYPKLKDSLEEEMEKQEIWLLTRDVEDWLNLTVDLLNDTEGLSGSVEIWNEGKNVKLTTRKIDKDIEIISMSSIVSEVPDQIIFSLFYDRELVMSELIPLQEALEELRENNKEGI